MNLSQFLIENIALIAAAIVSGTLLLLPNLRRGAGAGAVGAAEATRLANREKAVFVDVSNAAEFAAAHVTGSKNIPLAELESRAKDLPTNKQTPVIVVCASGSRASKGAAAIRKLGHARVMPLEGGLQGWRAAGMPVEKAA
jgi:rhodanese-related sulfurtransferase